MRPVYLSVISVLVRVFRRSTLRCTHRHPSVPKVPVHPPIPARLAHAAQIPSLTHIHAHVQPDPSPNLQRLALFLEILLQTLSEKHQGGTCVEQGFARGDVGTVFGIRIGSYAELDLVIERMRDSVTGKGDVGVEEELSSLSNG